MALCKSILILSPFSLGIFLCLLMNTILAEASLYPTKPIMNTTYIAGQAALVTWVEDGTKPLLATLGRVKIDLYAGRNTFLATVAKDIDPLALSTTVFIPSAIPPHYYLFNLRFKAASPATSPAVLSRPLPRPRLRTPSIVVYTADFSITPNPLSIQSIFPLQTSTSGKATRTSHSTTSSSFSETAHPNVTQTPILTPASRLAPGPTTDSAGKGKSGAVGLRSRCGMKGVGVMRIGISIKALMSLEIKFRLAFVIWPALIGLLMAV